MWRPTKYVKTAKNWVVSRDPAQINPASRVSASLALDATRSALRNNARGDLSDFGCGSAPLYGIYCEYAKSVTCIDWSASAHQAQMIDVSADLYEPVPIESECFDTIFSTSVLEHI